MSKNDRKLSKSVKPIKPAKLTIGVLLLPGFPLMSYASAVEPLRAANVLAGRTLYDWAHISIAGKSVRASSGIEIKADHRVGDDIALDMLLVCAGGNPSTFRHAPTLRWLRKMARRRIPIGGVSGGPFVLARAGLLDGYRCTIHWEHLPAFVEEFRNTQAQRSLFVLDRDRLTCAGGISALDMMHALIELKHGRELAASVSQWFLQTQVRLGSGPQQMNVRERFDVSSPALQRALELMETRTETPLSRQQLAQLVGLSLRQIERLFASEMRTTIGAHYLKLRLDRARVLLRQTGQPVLAIAVATGFVTASHFSRAYRRRFKIAPKSERRLKTPAPR